MNQAYQEWIDNYKGATYRKCVSVTKEMQEAFPELDRVRGHVHLMFIDEPQPHWWLTTTEGDIVDPTSGQWSRDGVAPMSYEPWDESKSEPTGKCPNCGNYCYDGNYLCCEQCEQEYRAYLGF